jgi:two-component system, sensor histidine kinase LadS
MPTFPVLHAILALYLSTACVLASAKEPLQLSGTAASHSLEEHLFWFRDPSGQLMLEDILNIDREGGFVKSRGFPSFGYTRDTVWIAFQAQQVNGPLGQWLLEITPAFLDQAVLFQVTPDGIIRHADQGDRQPWSGRALPWRHTLYPLTLPGDQTHTFYIRIQSTSSIAVNANLHRPYGFAANASSKMLLFGVALSLGLTVIGLSLILFLLLRQKIYLYLLFYIVSLTFCFAQLEGLIHFIVRPDFPLKLEWLQVIIQGIGLLAMTLLLCELTDLERQHPAIHTFLVRTAIAIMLIGMLPALFGLYHVSIPMLWAPIGLLVLATPFMIFFMRQKLGWIAFFYSAAFGLIAIGVLYRLLWVYGFTGPTPLSETHFLLSLSLHMALILAAMTGRYVQSESSLRQTSEQALLNTRESERRLESMVQERTAALEKTRDRLAASLKSERNAGLAQRRFLRMVAHEFRTPLSVIQMAADMIRGGASTVDTASHKNCDRIQQASERMASLIDQALREDRLDSIPWRANSAFIHLVELIQSSINYGNMVSSGRHRFEMECDDGLQVQGDHDLLLTMMNNIIDNAVKYSPANTIINLSAKRHEDGSASIRIADQGSGMTHHERDQVLDKYFRAERSLDVPGMGLGLYLVDRIARLHDARLDISSVPGQGTVFTVHFPTPSTPQEISS